MPKKVTANGKTFTFDDNVTEEQIGEAIDSYFSEESNSTIEKKKPTPTPIQPQSPSLLSTATSGISGNTQSPKQNTPTEQSNGQSPQRGISLLRGKSIKPIKVQGRVARKDRRDWNVVSYASNKLADIYTRGNEEQKEKLIPIIEERFVTTYNKSKGYNTDYIYVYDFYENKKIEEDFIKNATQNDIIQNVNSKSEALKNSPQELAIYQTTKEAKIGKLINDIQVGEKIGDRDVEYLKQNAPMAYKQMLKDVEQFSTDFPIQNINTVAEINKKRNDATAQIKGGESLKQSVQAFTNVIPEDMLGMGVINSKLQGVKDTYASELKKLEEQYPIETYNVRTSDGFDTRPKERPQEYFETKQELEQKRDELLGMAGRMESVYYGKKNPNASDVELGKKYVEVQSPAMYSLYRNAGNSKSFEADLAKMGIDVMLSSGDPNLIAKGKEYKRTFNDRYPEWAERDLQRKIGIEYFKKEGVNTVSNPNAISVKEADKLVDQFSDDEMKVYSKMRDRLMKETGFTGDRANWAKIPIPNAGGLVNSLVEGAFMPIAGTYNLLANISETDQQKAQRALTPQSIASEKAFEKDRINSEIEELLKKDKLNITEAKKLSELYTQEALKTDMQRFGDGSMIVAGQVLSQGGVGRLLGAGTSALVGGTSSTLKGLGYLAKAERVAELASNMNAMNNFGSGTFAFLSSYDDASLEIERIAPDANPLFKSAYATTIGLLNAGTEHIFKDVRIFDAFRREVAPEIASLVTNLSTRSITEEVFRRSVSIILKNKLPKYLGNVIKEDVKEGIEEATTEGGKVITQLAGVALGQIDPSQVNIEESIEAVGQVFKQTVTDGLFVAGVMGRVESLRSRTTQRALYELATNQQQLDGFIDAVSIQQQSGKMSVEDATDKIKTARTLNEVATQTIPALEKRITLDDNQKVALTSLLTLEKKLENDLANPKNSGIKSVIESQLADVRNKKDGILKGEYIVDENFNALTPEELKQKVAEEKQQEEELKKSISKVNTNPSFVIIEETDGTFSVLIDNEKKEEGFKTKEEASQRVLKLNGIQFEDTPKSTRKVTEKDGITIEMPYNKITEEGGVTYEEPSTTTPNKVVEKDGISIELPASQEDLQTTQNTPQNEQETIETTNTEATTNIGQQPSNTPIQEEDTKDATESEISIHQSVQGVMNGMPITIQRKDDGDYIYTILGAKTPFTKEQHDELVESKEVIVTKGKETKVEQKPISPSGENGNVEQTPTQKENGGEVTTTTNIPISTKGDSKGEAKEGTRDKVQPSTETISTTTTDESASVLSDEVKNEDVKVKIFKKGDGGTKGVFEGEDGKLYKSIEPQEVIQDKNGNFKEQTIEGVLTDEHEILSDLQNNPNIPKVGEIVNTTEGKAFEIEKLDEIDTFTKEEYRGVQKILNDLNDKGYHVGDKVTVMRRPKTGELVIVDFSAGYKGSRMSRDADEYMQNVKSKLSDSDKVSIEQEDKAENDRFTAEALSSDESTTEYYLTRRPPSIGTHPIEGLNSIEESTLRGRKVWKLNYDRKLSAKEIENFELTPKMTNKEFLGQKVKGIFGKGAFYISNIDYDKGDITFVSELKGKEISINKTFREFQKGLDEGRYEIEQPKAETPKQNIKQNEKQQPKTKGTNATKQQTPNTEASGDNQEGSGEVAKKQDRRGKTPKSKRKIKNPTLLSALKVDTAGNPYWHVLQYFINKGTYSAELLTEIYGKSKRGGNDLSGKKTILPEGEKRARIEFLNKKSFKTVDSLAEKLSEDYLSSNNILEGDDTNDSRAFRELLEDAINSFGSRMEMADFILEQVNQEYDSYIGEYDDIQKEYGGFADEAIDYLSNLSDEQLLEIDKDMDAFFEANPIEMDTELDIESQGKDTPKLSAGKTPTKTITKKAFDKLLKTLKKAFPNVDAFFDEKTLKSKLLENGVDFTKFLSMFDENRMNNESGIQFMQTPNRVIYGAKFPDGSVYLNPDVMSAETPLHEMSHVWESYLPKQWKEGLEIFKDTIGFKKALKEIQDNPAYSNKTPEEQASEALNTLIGRKGEGYYNSGVMLSKFKAWMDKFFKTLGDKIGKALGIKNLQLTPDQKLNIFVNDVLGDLLGEEEIVQQNDIQEVGVQYMKLPNGDLVKVEDLGVDVVNGFYSPLEKTINETKFDKLPVKQWIDKFAKGDEAKWTGLTDWLAQQQGSVSKADIQQYLKDNRISVVEVVKSDDLIPVELKFVKKEFDVDDYSATIGSNEEIEYVLEDEEVGYEIIKTDDAFYVRDSRGENIFKDGDYNNEIKSLEEAKRVAGLHLAESNVRSTDETKFSQYQLEGQKENYKEVLVTMPKKYDSKYNFNEVEIKEEGNFWSFFDKNGELITSYSKRINPTKEDAISAFKQNFRVEKKGDFKSSHFDEPNILVHLRMNTRTDAQGNKVLFLEEVQSDWGQQGKKEGFKQTNLEQLKNQLVEAENEYNKLDFINLKLSEVMNTPEAKKVEELREKINAEEKAITPAPFVMDTNAWTKLGLKVALKEAVKQGASKIAWTTGEQQNDRYDLRKQVDSINYLKNEDGTYLVYGKKGDNIVFKEKALAENKLEGSFGKDVAEKIINDKGNSKEGLATKVLEGDNLSVGGKGMKGFYGSPTEGSLGIVGNVAKSLFKQEPKTIKIKTGEQKAEINWTGKDWIAYNDTIEKSFKTKEEAQAFANSLNTDVRNATQHSIDITPELKAQVSEGLPMFMAKVNDISKSISKLSELSSKIDNAQTTSEARKAKEDYDNELKKDSKLNFIITNFTSITDQLNKLKLITKKGDC